MRVMVPLLLGLACLGWLTWRRVADHTWLIWPVLVAVPLLGLAGNEYRWARTETDYTRAVASILGEREGSAFGCERVLRNFFSSHGHVGHVEFDANGRPAAQAFLSMGTCEALRDYRHDRRQQLDPVDVRQIVAVHTLAHEAAHLSGVRDEAQAECLALGQDVEVMQRLGASPEQAAGDLARYRAEVYPRLPSDYQGTCDPTG